MRRSYQTLLAATLAILALTKAADPTCSTGLSRGQACCPSACGKCGGAYCYAMSKSLGTRCCPSGILKPASNTPSCESADPPCILPAEVPTPPTTPPTTLPPIVLPDELPADPTCATGLLKKRACCPSVCVKCGGRGCYDRSKMHSTRCCVTGILNPLNKVESCEVSAPPCIVPETPPEVAQAFSALTGEWSTAVVSSGALVERHEACAVMVRGEVVLLGGRGTNKPPSIYNPVTKMWRTGTGPGKSEMMHHMQCVVIDDSVWITVSWNGFFPSEGNNEHVYVYHVPTDSWSKLPGMPEARNRGGAAVVRRGDFFYVIAGNVGGHGEGTLSVPWMDEYNWVTNTWTDKKFPDMPGGGRDHVGGALVGDEICIAGGRDGGAKRFFRANKETTYCYNFESNAWSQRADFPVPRAGAMTATTCDGKMLVAGGEGNGQAFRRVDMFDGQTWLQGPDLVEARHSSGLAMADCRCGHIFIPSGSGGQGGRPELFTTEHYIPEGAEMECASY